MVFFRNLSHLIHASRPPFNLALAVASARGTAIQMLAGLLVRADALHRLAAHANRLAYRGVSVHMQGAVRGLPDVNDWQDAPISIATGDYGRYRNLCRQPAAQVSSTGKYQAIYPRVFPTQWYRSH